MSEIQSVVRAGLYARVSSDKHKEDEIIASPDVASAERRRRDAQVPTPDLRFIDAGWTNGTPAVSP